MVTVVPAPKEVRLNVEALTVGVKEAVRLEATIAEGTASTLTWTSGDGKVVAVSSYGSIKGLKAGRATVTVTTHNGKRASAAVTVKDKPSTVALSEKALTLEVGGTRTLQAKLPKRTASYTLKWVSSNRKVATVDGKGVVTAVAPGTARITVKTYNGKKASCRVRVMPPPTEAPTATPAPEATTPPPAEAPTDPPEYHEPSREPLEVPAYTLNGREVTQGEDIVVTITNDPQGKGERYSAALYCVDGGMMFERARFKWNAETRTITIPTADLEPGVYMLRVRAGAAGYRSQTADAGEITVKPAPERSAVDGFEMIAGVVVGYQGEGGDIAIPARDGKGTPVTAISDGAFAGNAAITTVFIPATVTEIGASAFEGCVALERVTLPKGVAAIGRAAFRHCESLRIMEQYD